MAQTATAYAQRFHSTAQFPLHHLDACTSRHRSRHQHGRQYDDDADEEEDEEDELSTTSHDDEDGGMLLDHVIDTRGLDVHSDHGHQPNLVPAFEQSHSRSTAESIPPIVVTYGPFHSPDVDVAVAYGQMVCYLWFWSPNSSSFDPYTSALQLQPQPYFISFLSKVITQTQLSKTVLVLALHYLWLLKRPVMAGAAGRDEANMGPVNAPSTLATARVGQGSEYTVSIIALMLANKFMDDNTYTNKSWAAICGVTLDRINTMEREFLKAINHALHVDVNRFMSWIRIMQSFFMQRQSRFDSRARSRKMAPLPHHHTRLDVAPAFATPPRSPGYGRARSASPQPFQFTFVPPIQRSETYHDHDTQNTLPSSLTGRSAYNRRPVIQHYPHQAQPQTRPRPVTAVDGGETRASMNSLSQTGRESTWFEPGAPSAQPGDRHGPMESLSLTIPIQRSNSKRSASQAFSPQSAEPPRPRPDDRVHTLVQPHPIHAHRRVRPQLIAYGSHHSAAHHHHPHPLYHRRIHQVHETLASSRPGSAVEVPFALMSLSSHGPSPVSDGPPPPTSSGHPQPSRSSAYPHLAAPFDPHTAPTFRNQGATEDQPLELQFYQLVQGGRGVLRCQPTFPTAEPIDNGSNWNESYPRHERIGSHETSASSAPGSATQESRIKISPSGLLSTDDEETMSSSESSNGTGWEHSYPRRLSSHLQQGYHPHDTQPTSQVVGGGYSLPPLSSLLADAPKGFGSPMTRSATHSSSRSPLDGHQVKYAEFANAGPPASYAPQWGFQVPSSTVYQVQYPPLQTAFGTPSGVRSGPASAHPYHHHHHPHQPARQHSSHLLPHHHQNPRHVQVSPVHAPNAFTSPSYYH